MRRLYNTSKRVNIFLVSLMILQERSIILYTLIIRICHDALRGAQKIINEGYIYVVDLDLERFFDTVSHSKIIEILSRTIKDGRVVSLIHKYLRSGVMNKGLFEASEKGTPQGE